MEITDLTIEAKGGIIDWFKEKNQPGLIAT